MGNKKFIVYKKTPFLLGLIFTIVLFCSSLLFKQEFSDISSYKISDFFEKYSMYIPIAIGIVSILIHYFLLLMMIIVRLNFTIISILIAIIIYGFWLFIGIDLIYLEPRYTDLAIALIDSYGMPLIVSSSSTIMIILLLSFLKKKNHDKSEK